MGLGRYTMIIFKARYKDVHPEKSDKKDFIIIHSAENPKFMIGDNVEIINKGYCYSSYKSMAVALGIFSDHWEESKIKGNLGTVMGIARHEDGTGNICAVKEPNGNTFLIEEDGLKFIGKQKHLEDKLFEI